MKIALSEIHKEKQEFFPEDMQWFPSEQIVLNGKISASVVLFRRDDETVILRGQLHFPALFTCDRCGSPVEQTVSEEFVYRITAENKTDDLARELECSEEDCTVLCVKDQYIDLDEILHEQAHLALPWKVLCSDECKGVCFTCGENLNISSCQCRRDDNEHSPFAVLKSIQKS